MQIVTDAAELAQATFVVEAVVEDLAIKSSVLARTRWHRRTGGGTGVDHLLALGGSVSRRRAGGRSTSWGCTSSTPSRRCSLVELVYPAQASEDTRRRALELCETFEKTPVEVPDVPGFVVNRLLFPYLFSAVRLVEETGMAPADVDTCMKLGAGHPMGPLALLDLVGLDVAEAIGRTIGESVPPRVSQLVAEGAFGRKAGRGFHTY